MHSLLLPLPPALHESLIGVLFVLFRTVLVLFTAEKVSVCLLRVSKEG